MNAHVYATLYDEKILVVRLEGRNELLDLLKV